MTASSPSRRSVLRGAAWAAPVVATVAAAPAYAASACASCPDVSFGTGTPTGTVAGLTQGEGRRATTNAGGVTWGVTSSGNGYLSSTDVYGFVAPVTTGVYADKGVTFRTVADPTSTRVVSLNSTSVDRGPCSVIRIGIVDLTSTAADPTITVLFGGVPCIGSYLGTDPSLTAGTVDRGLQTWTIPPAAPTLGVVGVAITYSAGSAPYDDINLYQPALSCT